MPLEDLIRSMPPKATQWVRSQRDVHRPDATPLGSTDRATLQSYFPVKILDEVRFKEVSSIENPDFFIEFEQAGQPLPLDFRAMFGITFYDTVLVSKSTYDPSKMPWRSLVFHELVHVVQYQLLGLDEFVARYLNGAIGANFDYGCIPLEKDAYALQAFFERGLPFSVEEQQSTRLSLRRAT